VYVTPPPAVGFSLIVAFAESDPERIVIDVFG